MEPGHAGNPGKMCETELEILEYGTYKVSLKKLKLFESVLRTANCFQAHG
jgi:hypothetical protein